MGQKVEDTVTGFSGFVMGRVEYVTGCAQVLVQPPCKAGAWVESRWFDEPRCKILPGKRIVIKGLSFGESIEETQGPDIPRLRSGGDKPALRK